MSDPEQPPRTSDEIQDLVDGLDAAVFAEKIIASMNEFEAESRRRRRKYANLRRQEQRDA